MSSLVEQLKRARQGDRATIELLLTEYSPLIRSVCNGFSPVSSEISRSDLYQEALLRVWSKLIRFEGVDDENVCRMMFAKWLRSTTRHVALDLLDRQGAKRRTPHGDAGMLVALDGFASAICETSTTPSQFVSEGEQAIRVRDAIASLDEPEGRIIQIVFFEELTLKQAAIALKITYDQARTRFAAAIEQLKFRLM